MIRLEPTQKYALKLIIGKGTIGANLSAACLILSECPLTLHYYPSQFLPQEVRLTNWVDYVNMLT